MTMVGGKIKRTCSGREHNAAAVDVLLPMLLRLGDVASRSAGSCCCKGKRPNHQHGDAVDDDSYASYYAGYVTYASVICVTCLAMSL